MSLQIDPEFKSLIPALSHEEYSQLEQNLIKETSPDSIILLTWNGILIDGHNRYEICTKHNIPFKTVEKNGFKDRDDAKVWIIQNQFGRRNINLYQRNKLALNLKEILEKKAKEKEALRKTIQQTKPIELTEAERLLNIQLDGHYFGDLLRGNTHPHHATPDHIYFIQDGDKVKIGVSCDIDSRLKDVTKHLPDAKLIGSCKGDIALEKSLHKTLSEHKINNEWFKLNAVTVSIIKAFVPNADFCQLAEVSSQKEVIKKFDTSERTLARVKVIEQKAAPELKQKLETGEASINEIYKEIQKEEKLQKRRQEIVAHVPLPAGKFKTIEADPPWKLESSEGKSAIYQYPLMDLDEIKKLRTEIDKIADDNCHLYLWAINPMLPDAFEVMKAWGFEYKTVLTWVKNNGFGTGHYFRGATEHILFGVRGKLDTLQKDQPTYFEANRTKHSEKPGRFYEIVERMSPAPYIRMFARSQRDSWISWGNEV